MHVQGPNGHPQGKCVLKHTRLVALSPKHSSFGICFNTI